MSRRKIAIIGAQGFEFSGPERQTDSYPWYELERLQNIRDYDFLVLNLLSREIATEKNWHDFVSVFSRRNAIEMLDSKGTIVVVGDPRFKVILDEQEVPFLSWTGMRFGWDNSPGDTVTFSDRWDHQAYQEYIRGLSRWSYSLRSVELDRDAYGELYNLETLDELGVRPVAEMDRIAANRYGNALAFSAQLVWRKKDRPTDEPISVSGQIVMLPRIDLSEEDTLNLVLAEVCGVEQGKKEPEWLETIPPLPPEVEIRKRIESLERTIDEVTHDIEKASTELARVREPLRLLYESGERLEKAVGEVLITLGAGIEFPESPGKEDGWIKVEIGGELKEAVLEVKGSRSGSFDEKGLRQLLEWITRGVELRRKRYKGIFVGTASSDVPPDERPDPFSVSWAESAQLLGVAALRGEVLYRVYAAHQLGRLDVKEFWRRLFDTSGVVEVGDLVDRDDWAD